MWDDVVGFLVLFGQVLLILVGVSALLAVPIVLAFFFSPWFLLLLFIPMAGFITFIEY